MSILVTLKNDQKNDFAKLKSLQDQINSAVTPEDARSFGVQANSLIDNIESRKVEIADAEKRAAYTAEGESFVSANSKPVYSARTAPVAIDERPATGFLSADKAFRSFIDGLNNYGEVSSNPFGNSPRVKIPDAAIRAGIISSGNAVPHDYVAPADPKGKSENQVISLFKQVDTNRQIIDLWTATGESNADIVAESTEANKNLTGIANGKKPYSGLDLTATQVAIKTIAHIYRFSRESLLDLPFLETMATRKGLQGLDRRYAKMIMDLIAADSRVVEQAYTDSPLDTILFAGALVEANADYAATTVLMNPKDAVKLRLKKTSSGAYLGGGPYGADSKKVWDYDIVTSALCPENFAYVGDFDSAGTVFRGNGGTDVAFSDSDLDNFGTNRVSARYEFRRGFGLDDATGIVRARLIPA